VDSLESQSCCAGLIAAFSVGSNTIFLLSFVGANGLLLLMKIEPGVGSVVKSILGRDCKLFLSLLFLITCQAPSS
jgi:hypothetical protein